MAFLCFHNSHKTSVKKVRMSLGPCSIPVRPVHQSLIVSSVVGAHAGLPTTVHIFAHRVRANMHVNRRCTMVRVEPTYRMSSICS